MLSPREALGTTEMAAGVILHDIGLPHGKNSISIFEDNCWGQVDVN
jgi:hypothetical protein